MKKVLLNVLIITIVIISMTTSVSASQPEEIHPLYDNIMTMEVSVYFSGDLGYATASSYPRSGVTYCEASVTVFRFHEGRWKYIDSWTKTSPDGGSIVMENSFPAISGYNYKAVLKVTAYRGSVGETAQTTHTKKCPGPGNDNDNYWR